MSVSIKQRHRLFKLVKSPLAQAISATILTSSVSMSALAQGTLEEMVVTATKRSESIMDVPLAITVVSGDFVREINLNDVKDLVKVTPGVTGNSQDSFLDAIAIRGISTNDFGNGGDPAIGIYKNGNYEGRNGSAVTSLFDIDRVEVLRGPQGFLFGRGAISGAISAHTAKANSDAGDYIEVDIGERGVLVAEGAVDMPLSENAGARLAIYHSEEDGWTRNVATGEDFYGHDKNAVRLSINVKDDKLEANFYAEYEERDQDGTIYRTLAGSEGLENLTAAAEANGNFAAPLSAGSNNLDFNADLGVGEGIFDRGEVLSLGLKLDYQLDGMTLTSITGFKDHTYSYAEDFDGTSVPLFYYRQDQDGDYLEQEVRLSSDTDGPLDWYAGASYYQENIDSTFLGQQAEEVYCGIYFEADCNYVAYYYGDEFVPSSDGQINDRNRTVGDFKGYAGYFDMGYKFSDAFDIRAGIRYTNDKKTFSQETLAIESSFAGGVQAPITPRVSDTQDWGNVTWRLVGNYHLENSLLFASVSTGAKSGGFGSFRVNEEGLPNSFDEETVTSFELGYKGTLLDGRAQLTGNLFYYQYEDLQTIFEEPGSPIALVGNIGEVTGKGFEGTADMALTDNVTLRLGGSLLDTETTGYQLLCDPVGSDACEGAALAGVPEWTFYAALGMAFPAANGEWQANILYTAEDDTSNNIQSSLSTTRNGTTDLQVSGGYESNKNWAFRLYVENLTDEDGFDSLDGSNTSTGDSAYTINGIGVFRPRTIGARFSYKF